MQDVDRSAFRTIIMRLYTAYDRQPPKNIDDVLDEYWLSLRRYSLEAIQSTFQVLKETNKRFPSIAEFVEQARLSQAHTLANQPYRQGSSPTAWDHRCPACSSPEMDFRAKGFEPMPDITMAICLDCGYKNAYTEYRKARYSKYPTSVAPYAATAKSNSDSLAASLSVSASHEAKRLKQSSLETTKAQHPLDIVLTAKE